ncbi:MAG: hypothetical protein HRU07_09945 [Nitrosopumilus sp.]|nr:hypothetical protein [Nitrosopumilus sp.]
MEIVTHDPQYDCHPYPLLKDGKESAFDDRQAVACHYLGNLRDEIIHTGERSKINDSYNVGIGYDPFIPQIMPGDFEFSEGYNSSEHIALESHNKTAMFIQEGYGKIYFDYPLGDIVWNGSVPQFENVTSFTTLYSRDFAAKDTVLDYYSMRYPEAPFSKILIVKSIDKDGNITNDQISVEVKPYHEIGTEFIDAYIFDKIKFDTDDKKFAEIIANDTYPMIQKFNGIGIINVTIHKTPVFFDELATQADTGDHSFSGKLRDLASLIDSPETLRLSMPYDIGLSVVSPTTISITVNDVTSIFNERYFSYGGKQQIIVNTQQDNVLELDRSIGKIIVHHPENFGQIRAVYVDDTAVNQKCNGGCVLLFQPEKELTISVMNNWDGVASAVSPAIERPAVPQYVEPHYEFIAIIGFVLGMSYFIYKKFKK